jgi:hypothetical protein
MELRLYPETLRKPCVEQEGRQGFSGVGSLHFMHVHIPVPFPRFTIIL